VFKGQNQRDHDLQPTATNTPKVAIPRWCLVLALALSGCGSSSGRSSNTGAAGGIGPDGGTFDGGSGITVVVPEGALSQPVNITLTLSQTEAPPVPGYTALSYPYQFGPDGTVFGTKGALVTLPLPTGAPTNSTILTTKLGDPLTYEDAHGTVSGSTITAQVSHFSNFVIAVTGMNISRSLHTATLLNNGKVLLAGGTTYDPASGEQATASAEVYDPATGICTSTGNMTTVRSLATATLLSDGRVLIVGGGTRPNAGGGIVPTLATAELYDPATGTFTATGNMNTARQGHTATLLPDGKVLIAGGGNDACLTQSVACQLYSAELYDPATGTFTLISNLMNRPREGHTATLLNSGKVLIVGGAFGDPELYDPEAGTFTGAGTFTEQPQYHTATLLPDGRVLIAGGDDLTLVNGFPRGTVASSFLYDPGAGTYTATGSMAQARDTHTATVLPSGKVLIAGGRGASPSLASWELYDPAAGTFTQGQMATERSEHTATLLPDGQVLIAGGVGPSVWLLSGGVTLTGGGVLVSVELVTVQ